VHFIQVTADLLGGYFEAVDQVGQPGRFGDEMIETEGMQGGFVAVFIGPPLPDAGDARLDAAPAGRAMAADEFI
jgi:hypothetical protein